MTNISLLDKIETNSAGCRHIFCTEGEAINLICSRIQELEYIPQNIQILQLGKAEVVSNNLKSSCFDFQTSLLSELQKILDCVHMGTRLYAIGSEQFVGNLRNYAYRWGMSDEELSWEVIDNRNKRVYCSTCHEINDHVNADLITCFNCGLKLEVWRHFSRLKNAYLGVCANAEQTVQ